MYVFAYYRNPEKLLQIFLEDYNVPTDENHPDHQYFKSILPDLQREVEKTVARLQTVAANFSSFGELNDLTLAKCLQEFAPQAFLNFHFGPVMQQKMLTFLKEQCFLELGAVTTPAIMTCRTEYKEDQERAERLLNKAGFEIIDRWIEGLPPSWLTYFTIRTDLEAEEARQRLEQLIEKEEEYVDLHRLYQTLGYGNIPSGPWYYGC